MKISQIPIGSTVKCNGSTALIIKHGEMGCYVKVLTVKIDEGGFTGMSLGFQVWSSSTECTLNEQNDSTAPVLPQNSTKLPLNLFRSNK